MKKFILIAGLFFTMPSFAHAAGGVTCKNQTGTTDYYIDEATMKVTTITNMPTFNISNKQEIKNFKFTDSEKKEIEIVYPEIAKKYPFMASRTVLNLETGEKKAYSTTELKNTVICSVN